MKGTLLLTICCLLSFGLFSQPKNKLLEKVVEEPFVVYARESLTSNKQIARPGILTKRPNAKATVLLCHGFMCDMHDISFLDFIFKDFNTIRFNFRGHGDDDCKNQNCTLGRDEVYDVIAVANWARKHPELHKKPLIAYGFSMGAVAAIIAQAQDKKLFDALILDCPFDSTDKVLERIFAQLKINLFGYEVTLPSTPWFRSYAYSPYVQGLLKNAFRALTKIETTQINTAIAPVFPEEAIQYVSAPCFFISCINDDKAPFEAVKSVYDGAKGFKRLWLTEGRRHYDSIFFQMRKYAYKVNQFIKKCIERSYTNKKNQKVTKDIQTQERKA